MELTEEEKLRWNSFVSSKIKPKYKTERSKKRVKRLDQIVQMTSSGATISEIKEVVGGGCENIAAGRRRAVWKGGV